MMADHFWSQDSSDTTYPLFKHDRGGATTQIIYTIVIIVDPQLPRAQWPIGKVVKVNMSDDGCICTAEVRVGKKTYLRPVARLVQVSALPEDSLS